MSCLSWQNGVDAIDASVFVVDIDFVIRQANKYFCTQLKKSFEDIIGQKYYELLYREDEEKSNCPLRRIFTDKSMSVSEIENSVLGISLIINSYNIYDKKGSVVGVFHSAKNNIPVKAIKEDLLQKEDISVRTVSEITSLVESKEKEKELLAEQKESLQEEKEQLEQFSHVVAHDLKSPLVGIKGFAELLNEDYRDNLSSEGRDYLGRIIANAENMQVLIEDLLNIAKIENTKISFEVVALDSLLKVVLDRFQFLIDQHSVTICKKKILPEVVCDRVRIKEVFANLISNAIKYSVKQLGVTPCIEIGYKEDEKEYQFYVKDNGIGIPLRFQKNIFDEFEKIHSKSTYDGTGLGLSIVKRIVNDHQGDIWVESKEGEGSIFYFTIAKNISAS